jgi:hypothetical protein
MLLGRGETKEGKEKNNWNRYPDAMLRARGATTICKIVCPEGAIGVDALEVLYDEARTVTVDEGTGEVRTGALAGGPRRDYAREVDALKLEISAVTTKSQKDALIDKIKSADLPPMWEAEVRKAYAAKFAPAQAKGETTKPATSPSPASAPAGRQPGED